MSSVFWWLNPVRLYSLYKNIYTKRRIESYSTMGTKVSPNKILLMWAAGMTKTPVWIPQEPQPLGAGQGLGIQGLGI